MKITLRYFSITLIMTLLLSFTNQTLEPGLVIISTRFGEIKIRLYDETPLHKDNFIKLISGKFYDSLLFHRVIKDFMVQGGDPESKNASKGVLLGNGGPGYNIPAEFVPGLIHKIGALAAAREADMINPKKESSGSQFYIVQGKVFTDKELDNYEIKINQNLTNQLMGKILMLPENQHLRTKLDSVRNTGSQEGMLNFMKDIQPLAEAEMKKNNSYYKFSPVQRKIYTTAGGAPHLDGSYTVFGEVVEGMNIIDSIANAKVDENNRPLEDIRMTIRLSE